MNKKIKVDNIIIIIENIIISILYFIPIIVYNYILQGEDINGNDITINETEVANIYSRFYENNLAIIIIVSLGISLLSIIFAGVQFFIKNNKVLSIIKYILFLISSILLFVCWFIAEVVFAKTK